MGKKEKVKADPFQVIRDAPVDYLGRVKPKVKANEFWCVQCQKVYNKGWSDQEALDEVNEFHPGIPLEEMDYLCDDCFQVIEAWRRMIVAPIF